MAKAAGGGILGAGAIGGTAATVSLFSGLMGGFGLKTSAAALDGSAAALTEAAAVLSGGKVAGRLRPLASVCLAPRRYRRRSARRSSVPHGRLIRPIK